MSKQSGVQSLLSHEKLVSKTLGFWDLKRGGGHDLDLRTMRPKIKNCKTIRRKLQYTSMGNEFLYFLQKLKQQNKNRQAWKHKNKRLWTKRETGRGDANIVLIHETLKN